MKLRGILALLGILLFSQQISGCVVPGGYATKESLTKEPTWIREGQPILYNNQNWYPTEDVENLTDNEMDYIGEYNDVAFYVDKIQVKPFNRLYTKFGYHKYRVFLRQESHD